MRESAGGARANPVSDAPVFAVRPRRDRSLVPVAERYGGKFWRGPLGDSTGRDAQFVQRCRGLNRAVQLPGESQR